MTDHPVLSRPTSKAGRLQRACLAVLEEHERDGALPTSGRFIWYELVQRGTVDKAKARGHPGVRRGIDQDVSDALTYLREQGVVPWDWIEDETRSTYLYTGASSVLAGVRSLVATVRLDPWAGQPAPLILTESRSLAGVLRGLADTYCCDIAGTNGQAGGFLRTRVAPLLGDGQRILYLGDLDLSGNQIEANTRRVLEGYATRTWERLALTATQVDELVRDHYDGDRSRLVIIKRDSRYGDGRPHEAVETEALRQRVIVELVRARLDALLPEPLDDVLVRERRERAAVAAILNTTKG